MHARPALRETLAGARRRFRDWRGTRPFWAGLLTLLAAGPILYFPYLHLSLGGFSLALSTTAGAGSLIIGILLIVLGMTLWLQQQVRVFAGIAAILLSLVSLPVANLGGFLLGLLPGVIGGALACAWGPPTAVADTPTPSPAAPAGSGVPPSEAAQNTMLRRFR